jgi:flagellar biogenesis protein FliO
MRALFLLLAIFGGILASTSSTLAAPHTLKDVRLSSLSQAEQIRLQFLEPYPEEPIVNFEPGALSVRLLATSLDPNLPPEIRPPEGGLIRSLRVSQPASAEFVQVDILFNSTRMALGNPEIWRENDRLYLDLQFLNLLDLETSAQVPTESNLLREAGQRVQQGDLFPSTFARETPEPQVEEPAPALDTRPAPVEPDVDATAADKLPLAEDDWANTMITLLLSLLFILGLIYALALLYNRFLSGKIPTLESNIAIRQVSAFHLGPKQKVVVLEIQQQLFACGVTPTSVNLLSRLENEKDQTYLHALETKDGQVNLDESRMDFLRTLQRARQQASQSVLDNAASSQEADMVAAETDTADYAAEEAKAQREPRISERISARMVRTPVYAPVSAVQPVSQEDLIGSSMQDFAGKLTERLKSLKPIR